jgi:hypothetical protein
MALTSAEPNPFESTAIPAATVVLLFKNSRRPVFSFFVSIVIILTVFIPILF